MRLALALFALLLCAPARADTLAPLLATLHRAQDALAVEGEAARAVHDRLLQLIDARIAGSSEHETGSLVVYALSGGDPRIAARALAAVPQTARDAILVRGALAYVSGRNGEAAKLLALIRPGRLRGRLASLVAMAQAGLALRAGDREAARRGWRRVRLQAPGTLLEEAALRRLIDLAGGRRDAGDLFRLLRRYWMRFPRSAFRAQVARAMRDVSLFEEDVVLAHLPRLAAVLPPAIRSNLYAHLAREALVDGRTRLARVAARRKGGRDAPQRARFLKALARLAGPDVREVRARLDAMQAAALPPDDRALLEAARAVGGAVLAPVAALPPRTLVMGDLAARHRSALDAADALLVRR